MHHREELLVGERKVLVGAWSPGEYFVPNWSLKPVRNQNDVSQGNAELQRLTRGLRYAFFDMDMHRAYAPKIVPPSGKITDVRSLTERIRLDEEMYLHRGKDSADGVRLAVDDGFMASLGGCGLVVAAGGQQVLVAHAALDSLIHPEVAMGKKSIEKEPGIVNAMVDWFLERAVPTEEISMCMLFAIPAMAYKRQFNHPTFGPYNTALWKLISNRWPSGAARRNGNMFLNLENLFLEQARQRGVRNVRTKLSLAELPDLTHTYTTTGNPNVRYLAVVKRCS